MNNIEQEAVREVRWRDQPLLSKVEITTELLLSIPWLVGSLVAAANHYYFLALGCSFVFFLTGLQQVHNAYHYALGLERTATEWIMFVHSILMLGSMHAVQINHLRHHRFCMEDEDIEAMSARLPFWRAILIGPVFPLRLHQKALNFATPIQLRWIHAELLANIVWIWLVFGVLELVWMKYHVVAMAVGQCLTAFFAVWTVHHGCDEQDPIARSIRNPIKGFLTYNMFYHYEHHLFPAVPTCHLPIIAKRLDSAVPELCIKPVF